MPDCTPRRCLCWHFLGYPLTLGLTKGGSVNTLVSSVSRYFLGAAVPWSFRILVMLLFILICGGLYLDYLASTVTYPDVFASQEIRIDPATKQETRTEKVGLNTDDRKLLVEWAKDKSQRLNESAKLLYDFAKIVLGALIASLTQLISAGLRQANRPVEEPSESKGEKNEP